MNSYIQQINDHTHPEEIYYMIALFLGYNIRYETAFKYELNEYCTDELINLFNSWLNGYESENLRAVWELAFIELGPKKIQHIIDHIIEYIAGYSRIVDPLEEIKNEALQLFTSV